MASEVTAWYSVIRVVVCIEMQRTRIPRDALRLAVRLPLFLVRATEIDSVTAIKSGARE
jgi:hypothetical protein